MTGFLGVCSYLASSHSTVSSKLSASGPLRLSTAPPHGWASSGSFRFLFRACKGLQAIETKCHEVNAFIPLVCLHCFENFEKFPSQSFLHEKENTWFKMKSFRIMMPLFQSTQNIRCYPEQDAGIEIFQGPKTRE